ncbi:SRPBCC family protein [Vulcanisaeta sp. JCM 14467]|uniref:SRPBCC family protein n=1 Tax=Vulcanisaeta sp. JCM 14467 TaxID=1295370 RepID=UPI0006D24830|nr:SRPBCC family protein [Vulcanisaeta sp. JCM 14467]
MSILGIEFTARREVNPGDLEKVWQVLSDISNMPRYWRGHREVEILSRDDDAYIVRIRFAFPGLNNRGVAKIEVHGKEKAVVINYVEGPIKGYVKNYISNNVLISQWNVRITPFFLIIKPWIKRHFMSGAGNALARIVGEAVD